MYKPATDWNPKQALLKDLLKKQDKFQDAIHLCREMHRFVHLSSMSSAPPPKTATLEDEVWDGLTDGDLTVMPTKKDVTIAWNLWHITRIEDLTMNILVRNTAQILDDAWLKKLNVAIKDTGNAMTDEEIIDFSSLLDIEEFRNYRNKVGEQTQQILCTLTPEDIKRKFSPESLDRIRKEGGVTSHPDSIWLLDFWGRKDVAGILQMPITRHQVVHLNDSLKIKEKIKKRKKMDEKITSG